MVCTGRHHGFESLAEQRLLLALDFLGVDDLVSQPLELRMATASGFVRHVPDFFMLGLGGRWLIDVRPAERVWPADREKFAGTAEVALTLGWRYAVVAGWRSNVIGTLDALSAQRRPIGDPLGLQAELLDTARQGPLRFADLVGATAVPVMARAHALHLLWHKALSIDLALPLGDNSIVSVVAQSLPGRRR